MLKLDFKGNKSFDPLTGDLHNPFVTQPPRIPQVFDRPLQRARLARALAGAPADFLLARAVEDMAARLDTTLRPFSRALDIGTPDIHAAAMLRARPGGKDDPARCANPGAGACRLVHNRGR